MSTYLRFLFAFVIGVLVAAATLNYLVDPENIYREGGVNPKSYARALINSEHGLWDMAGTNDERLLAKEVSVYSNRADCVVVGSSHVMQIGNNRAPRPLLDICQSFLNLGVSGGSIQDHITLAYLAIKNGQSGHPTNIILGVDPWIFSFNKDRRWFAYRDEYQQAKVGIGGLDKRISDDSHSQTPWIGKLTNLINLEYTIRSVRTLVRDYRQGSPTIKEAPNVDITSGGEYPVRLRDNSYVYDKKHIAESARTMVPLGGSTYLTDGKLNQDDAINAYRGLLLWIRAKGVEPILLLTPYHENVFRAPQTPNTVAITATEPLVLQLAHEMGIRVLGSYDPKMFGCLNGEFYDFMHPTADCLKKLQWRP